MDMTLRGARVLATAARQLSPDVAQVIANSRNLEAGFITGGASKATM